MGLVYLPILMVYFYGKLVGKYTSLMNPMGNFYTINFQVLLFGSEILRAKNRKDVYNLS